MRTYEMVGVSQQQPVSRQVISKQQMVALMRSASFGEAVMIMMRSPKHKDLPIGALRLLILPAIIHNRYMIVGGKTGDTSRRSASGLVLWASVSDEIHNRLQLAAEPMRLAPNDWKSGSHLWLVDFIAPRVLASSILQEIDSRVGKGKPIHVQVNSEKGEIHIKTVQDLIREVE